LARAAGLILPRRRHERLKALAARANHVILSTGCGGKPAMNKHRMNKELFSFAARLRGRFFVGNDVRSLLLSVGNNEPPHVGCYEEFDSLALELFALQFQSNPAYRTICRARGATPDTVEHWTQIPAVPTGAFKELELSCIRPKERTAVFHSSGTTEQKPSRHFHCAESLAVYGTSLWNWFERNVFWSADGSSASSVETRGRAARAPFAVICLTPPPRQAPHSSLICMFETARQKLGAPESAFVGKIGADGAWTLDFAAALAALHQSPITNYRSLLVLGTAFSFVHLVDFLAGKNLRLNLPAGSRVMETGGYKNRSRSMPKAALHALITERLGVPAENIICEYGMSELSSQAYALGAPASSRRVSSPIADQDPAGETPALPGCFHFPPWARAQIISPETGREVADGETGLIRMFDLANVFSVAAIQTEDLAVRRGDGFELIGRAPKAEPRGCSLLAA
jgi:hypothetical protein